MGMREGGSEGNEMKNQKKILLVEDDPFLIDIYTTKLQEAGFEVAVVDDGKRAVAVAQKERPKLIVLDIVLPHVDGWEVLSQIKADAQLANTKVLILSNLGQKEEREKGFRLGAAGYLIKAHYTPSQVADEIKKMIA